MTNQVSPKPWGYDGAVLTNPEPQSIGRQD